MWNETVTLYIDDTSIRLMVTSGQRIKKWADLKLEPGLVKDAVVIQEVEVASIIKKLLKSQKIRTRQVILGYSGLHSLTRPAILPQLPKSMLFEAIAREARRVLPLPLDQLYLSWRTIPCPKGRIQVFIAATPRKIADSFISTLHEAGLKPYRMAMKPLSLTQALSLKTAILVDLQPSEFDIVVVSNGIPQPVRTIALPEEELLWNKKLEMIASDLDRTIKFFDTNNPEKPLNASVPVFVSGELINKPDLQKSLSDITGHPVTALSAWLKGIEEIDSARYMFNVTMAMKTAQYESDAICSAGNLNVLPMLYRPKPISMVRVVGIPAGVAIVALLITLITMIHSTSDNIGNLQKQFDVINQMVKQKTAQKADLNKSLTDLGKQASDTKTAFESLNEALADLQVQQEHVNGDLSIILNLLPSDIDISGISEDGNTLTLNGTAPNEGDIYKYAQTVLNYGRQLDLSHRFTETTLTNIHNAESTNQTAAGQTVNELIPSDATPIDQTQPTPTPTLSPAGINFTLTFKR